MNPLVLTELDQLAALLRQRQLTNLALASMNGDSSAIASQLAQHCQQLLGATLLVDLTKQTTVSWQFAALTAHTEIQQRSGIGNLPAPQQRQQLDSAEIAEAMLRWHCEFPQVLLHCGKLDCAHGWMAAQGCEGLLLVVEAADDNELQLARLLQACKQRQLPLLAIYLNRSRLLPLGRRLAQCYWLPQPLRHWFAESPILAGQ
ncbi:hypothetical protein [Ferrimonas senticii]|uniref:hypothetical protein n=1 Tax=Ferrimonas senticii TaxID=394566 RepID=UPI0003FAADC6|nr:hypothetical protein [Ferrimonas senticii]